jgi:transposase
VLFVGDDWAEEHHDVELQDETGRRLGKARLEEGVAGIAKLHELIGRHLAEGAEADQVMIGIETDRGPWVQALIAAGYRVYAVNPLSVARYRERHSVSGAKSDAADARTLADMVRTDRHQHRVIAGDTPQGEAIKVVARAHKTLVWERTRHAQRLRHALREYFPAALAAFDDLTRADTLELLAMAPDPASAAKLTLEQISAALRRARRRNVADKALAIQVAMHRCLGAHRGGVCGTDDLRLAQVMSATLNEQIKVMEGQVEAHFGRHPDAEIYLSQPGLAHILGARVLGEFGDDPNRYDTPNPAGTMPVPARSPGPPARRKLCWHDSCTTTGSSMPWALRHSPH